MNQRSSTGYYIGYKPTNSSDPYRYHTLEPSAAGLFRPEVTLIDLAPFTSYTVSVQAFNSAGAGPSSQPIITRTDEDGPCINSRINTVNYSFLLQN